MERTNGRRGALKRRGFLAGVGGLGVALPWLEKTASEVKAAPAEPLRYLVAFGGTSIGTSRDEVVPKQTGVNYTLTRGLATMAGGAALGYDSVVPEIQVVSGMTLPWERVGSIPAGGRSRTWHTSMLSPLLSGVRSQNGSGTVHGPTSDQLVAAAIGTGTRFRSLEYRVQADHYLQAEYNANHGRMSWTRDGAGRVVPNDPVTSPRLAYDQLFSGFTPADPADLEKARSELRERRTVLDLVRGSAERLMGTLGSADRQRLQRHFDEIRDLERRLATIPEPEGVCAAPTRPGADPAPRIITDRSTGYERTFGWAEEDTRARVLGELIAMAFICDQARVATWMMTFAQSFLNAQNIVGVTTDIHNLSHDFEGEPQYMADGIAWHVEHFSRLVARLRDVAEGEVRLLDRVAMVLLFEGGWGLDPDTGNQNVAHSSERMIALVAGRAGGLGPGRHIVHQGGHPTQVVISAMNAVGVTGGLGEVTGQVPALFSA